MVQASDTLALLHARDCKAQQPVFAISATLSNCSASKQFLRLHQPEGQLLRPIDSTYLALAKPLEGTQERPKIFRTQIQLPRFSIEELNGAILVKQNEI